MADILPRLDLGIRRYVQVLIAGGVETYESCQGGPRHSYPEPTVGFYGDRSAGWQALSVAFAHGFAVKALRRTWVITDGEVTGPTWELVFWRTNDA